jgi:Predicted transcriptional regulator
MVFTRHCCFALCRDSLRVAFECDRLLAKVIQSRGKPFLKLPTVDEEPGRPDAGLHLHSHHPCPRLRPRRRGRVLGPRESAGGARLDGGVGRAVKAGMFVTRVTGTSMEPLIPDGSWCLFRPRRPGSREGRIVRVQFASLGVGEYGGRFTVKKYHSEKTVTADGWRHFAIQLVPLNPESSRSRSSQA